MPSPDLMAANFGLPQSMVQPMPTTLASAATIAPTTLITNITGAAAIVNITPPLEAAHMLIFLAAGAITFTAAGNIQTAVGAAAAGVTILAIYNPATRKYWVGKLAIV